MIQRLISHSMQSAILALAARVRGHLLPHRRTLVVAIHLGAVVLTSYLALWLRFDGELPPRERQLWISLLPWLLVIRAVSFVPFRLYEGLWRYSSIWDLENLVLGVTGGSFAFYLLTHHVFGFYDYPRSVFIIDSMLLVMFLGGLRLLPRVYRDVVRRGGGKRLLVFGAGDAGEMILRDMLKYPDYHPVGFIDDDARKTGLRIHGVPVLGTRAELPRIIARTRPDEVLVAVSKREVQLVQDLVRVLEPFKVPITTIPALRHLIDGKVAVNQIRELSIEDLLTRAPIGLDERRVRVLFEGRCVMVTGAGGSIGSELCHQIAAFRPKRLILYERYENSLYAVANQLQDRAPTVDCESVIGDITDEWRLDNVLSEYKPAIILHAAAHKHVPLMEYNCCEAVKNNVQGTITLATAAQRHNVERFILISSDKAVNPSSVMGATKRVAELSLQSIAPRGRTCFTTVRFGNVLGSNGSVVPRFLQQIRAGGPVTVTHPEMERYFMLISEAVQLVLHAAALGQDKYYVYVLDMGAQIKLVDLARNLIRLSGFIADDEIPIHYVGMRPGEKLSEELTFPEEQIEPSPVEKVMRVKTQPPTAAGLEEHIRELTRLARIADAQSVIEQLCRIVPSFQPDPTLIERVTAARADVAEIIQAADGTYGDYAAVMPALATQDKMHWQGSLPAGGGQ